jgi:hypothetical protein
LYVFAAVAALEKPAIERQDNAATKVRRFMGLPHRKVEIAFSKWCACVQLAARIAV